MTDADATTLPLALLEAVGRRADPKEPGDVLRADIGNIQLALRRDCQGALRKLEVTFPTVRRHHLRTRISELGTWLTVLPGRLELMDITGVGKTYLLEDRLEVTFRTNTERSAIKDFVTRCTHLGAFAGSRSD